MENQDQNQDQNNHDYLGEYFDQIYIINLKRRPDRLEKVKKRLEKHSIKKYQIIEAFDGHSPDGLAYYHWKHRNHNFFETPGALGVLMSAMIVMNDVWKHKYRRFLILEDDVVFIKDFQKKFSQKIKKIPEDWKMLFFGTSMHRWRLKERCNYFKDYFQAVGSIPGAFAVGLTLELVPRLVQLIKNASKAWDTGVLSDLNKMIGKDVYIFRPYLIVCNTEDSDLRRNKTLQEKQMTSDWKLDLYDWD